LVSRTKKQEQRAKWDGPAFQQKRLEKSAMGYRPSTIGCPEKLQMSSILVVHWSFLSPENQPWSMVCGLLTKNAPL